MNCHGNVDGIGYIFSNHSVQFMESLLYMNKTDKIVVLQNLYSNGDAYRNNWEKKDKDNSGSDRFRHCSILAEKRTYFR